MAEHETTRLALQRIPYCMTELLTLSFHAHHLPISLTTRDFSSPSSEQKIRNWQGTPAGLALADFVRILVDFRKGGHVNRVLWGQISEEWSKVVVLLDWSNLSGRSILYTSTIFIAAKDALREFLTHQIDTRAFSISDANTRNQCFGRSAAKHAGIHGTVPLDTALYYWRVPQGMKEMEIVLREGGAVEVGDSEYNMIGRDECRVGSESDDGSDGAWHFFHAPEEGSDPNVQLSHGSARSADIGADASTSIHIISKTFEDYWEQFARQYQRRCTSKSVMKDNTSREDQWVAPHPIWGGAWEMSLPSAFTLLMGNAIEQESDVDGGSDSERETTTDTDPDSDSGSVMETENFLGIIATYRDFHRAYLRRMMDPRYEYTAGGIGELTQIAAEELEVWHVEFWVGGSD